MDALPQHMLDVTDHCDHQLLEISIWSAVQQIAGAHQARMLGIFISYNEMVMRPNAWIIDGKVGFRNEMHDDDQGEERMSLYPAWVRCIEKMGACAKEVLPDNSCKLWFPIWVDGKVSTCLEIHGATAFSRKMLE
jgi:hypothetical protein